MVQKKVRVRFAPSPTGYLHVGNARTALFNWLFAQKESGDFILRIEDTDIKRSARKYEDSIINDLRWLKLDWIEGPDIGGPYGPYRQSLRKKIYQRYAQNLISNSQAYCCYCQPEELEKQRREALQKGETVRYDNRCRLLTPAQRSRYEKKGLKPAVRFKVPPREVVFKDLVRGEIRFDTSLMGDFIILRPDGSPSFNFAVVLDDSLMEITHVIRGEDHLSNTPRHILLFEALGFPLPQFAHMSLTLGPDQKLLSKRHGAISISAFREKGCLPEGLINYITLLGWAPPGEKEIMTVKEMVELFSLQRLTKSAAIFDRDKLSWVNGHHIRMADPDRLANLAIPFLKKAKFIDVVVSEKKFAWVRKIVGVLQEHLHDLSDINDYAPIFFNEKISPANKEASQVLKGEGVVPLLKLIQEDLSSVFIPPEVFWKKTLAHAQQELGVKGKKLYLPLRVALTGHREGPELKDMLPLIPLKLVKKRVEKTIEKLVNAK